MNGEIGFSGTLEGFVNAGGGGGDVPDIYADATVDNNTGTPAVTVTKTSTATSETFHFAFQNLKGADGAQGAQGIQGIQGVPGAVGPQGPRGFTGATGATGPAGDDGYSPAVTITDLTGGHRVTITDETHPLGQSFDVMDGEDGATGAQGPQGPAGVDGVGVPAGGTTSQVLAKEGPGDYLTHWVDPTPDALPLLSDEYDDHTAYDVGDYCIYENTLYKCNTAISPYEVWDSTHWDACTVGEEIAAANSEISTLSSSLTYKEIVTNLDVTTSVVTKTIPSIANANDIYLFGKVNSTYRGSLVVPYSVFSTGVSCYIPVIGGNVTGTIYIEYVSNTSIKVSSSNAVFNYLDMKIK